MLANALNLYYNGCQQASYACITTQGGICLRQRDMTQGSIWKQILLFSVPLLLGNLLQQLYNAFDAIVVGNYVSADALAAVGSSGVLINMIIAFFMGMSMGTSVLVSQAFGAKDKQTLHDAVHTGMTFAIVLGLVLTAVGVGVSPLLLRWMQTPDQILEGAVLYLRVYFSGLLFLTIYNMGTAILTAMGDAKRPLYFLTLSAALNISLNLLFVVVFKMGIAGVAWSTVIAQAISAGLVVVTLCRTKGDHRLVLREIRFHKEIGKRVARIGLPGGIQSAIISGSNIIVQAYINGLGAAVVAGYSASSKLDAFIMLPVQTMAMAVTTFVGQNLGAGQVARARQGTRVSIMMGLGISISLSVLVLTFGNTLLKIFTPDAEVVTHGFAFMRVFVPFYFVLCFTQIIPGALRGAGDVRTATVTCIASFVGLRQIYLFIVTKIQYSIVTVSLGYPITWCVAAIVLIVYYRKTNWSRFEISTENAGVERGASV